MRPDEPSEFVYWSSPDFVDALEIFAAIIGGTPQQAEDQLRSRSELEGPLGRPASYAHYENADLAIQAAVLAHGIAQAQSFLDGNKRAALVAMLTFLELNGCGLTATDRELADWIISFSVGATPAEVAQQIRHACSRPPEEPCPERCPEQGNYDLRQLESHVLNCP